MSLEGRSWTNGSACNPALYKVLFSSAHSRAFCIKAKRKDRSPSENNNNSVKCLLHQSKMFLTALKQRKVYGSSPKEDERRTAWPERHFEVVF
jgi:hypothetical protein